MKQFHPVEPLSHNAELILPLVLDGAKSVVDFGCNNGQWLAECLRLGVKDILGIDGFGMREHLVIPQENFILGDLSKPLDLEDTFDLALCIEVAEHLPPEAADTLLDTLTLHSERILFSAATPGQGGYRHLNEQPFGYWRRKFFAYGYSCDISIREKLPEGVAWWLKNNLALVTRQ